MAKIFIKKRVNILSNVRTTYMNCYPSDVEGININNNVSFAQVLARMQEGENFYEIIGICDSLIRERIFNIMAIVGGVKYDDIYTLWLHFEDLRKNYLASIF